jgi:hypothetical protein
VVGRLLDLGDAVDIDSGARFDRPHGGGGTMPRETSARATAISTRSMPSKRACSVQMAPISGSV